MTSARLAAELYALTHRGTLGDAAFYARLCADAKSVLELGAGYGRLLGVLARSGRAVTGLEHDAELLLVAKRALGKLPLAKRRSLRLVHADMRCFALGRQFERVLLPYNGVYCLLTKRDVLACFRAAHAALEPGGRFAFDVWNAEGLQLVSAQAGAAEAEPIVALRHAGRTWDVFERSRVRRGSRCLDVSYEYVPRAGGASYLIRVAQRSYRVNELTVLLERAGFVVERRYGSFSGTRFTPRSAQLIVVARALILSSTRCRRARDDQR